MKDYKVHNSLFNRKRLFEDIRSRGRTVRLVDDPTEKSLLSATRHIKIIES